MDDDTRIDYNQLAASLHAQDPKETNIYCPSVLRNQKLWRDKAAPVMGKWAYLNDNFTSKSTMTISTTLHFTVSRELAARLLQW